MSHTISREELEQIIREEAVALLAEKKKINQDGPGNPYRDEDGHYSSYKDSSSWSHGGDQREMKSAKDVKPCGRGQRRKCKSPQELMIVRERVVCVPAMKRWHDSLTG